MGRERGHVVPDAGRALDSLKYEVADELGLLQKLRDKGWDNMTTRECGLVGGHMVRRLVKEAEKSLNRG